MHPRRVQRGLGGGVALRADLLAAVIGAEDQGVGRIELVEHMEVGAGIRPLPGGQQVRRRVDEGARRVAVVRAEHQVDLTVRRMGRDVGADAFVVRRAAVLVAGQQDGRIAGQEADDRVDIARGRVVIGLRAEIDELSVVVEVDLVLVGLGRFQRRITRRRAEPILAEHDQRIELAAAGAGDLARIDELQPVLLAQLVGHEQAGAVIDLVARPGRCRGGRRIGGVDLLVQILDAQAGLDAQGAELALIGGVGRAQHLVVVELGDGAGVGRSRRRDRRGQGQRLEIVVVADRVLDAPAQLQLLLRLVVVAQRMRPVAAELVDRVAALRGTGRIGVGGGRLVRNGARRRQAVAQIGAVRQLHLEVFGGADRAAVIEGQAHVLAFGRRRRIAQPGDVAEQVVVAVIAQRFLGTDALAGAARIVDVAGQVGAFVEIVFGGQVGRDVAVRRLADIVGDVLARHRAGRRVQGFAVAERLHLGAGPAGSAATAAAAIAAGAVVEVEAAVQLQLAEGFAGTYAQARAALVAGGDVERGLRLNGAAALHDDVDDAAGRVGAEGRAGVRNDFDAVDVVGGQALQREGAVVALHLGRLLAVDIDLDITVAAQRDGAVIVHRDGRDVVEHVRRGARGGLRVLLHVVDVAVDLVLQDRLLGGHGDHGRSVRRRGVVALGGRRRRGLGGLCLGGGLGRRGRGR